MNILVTNVPAVYRIDLYEKLGSLDWKVFFYSRNSKSLKYCVDDRTHSFPFEDVSLVSIFQRLVKLQPEVVVCINASPFTLLCGIFAKLFNKKFIIWWAGTDISEKNTGLMKRMFRNFVFKLANSFFVYSEFAGAYLIKMGVSDQKIYVLGNMTFDPVIFRSKVDTERAKTKSHAPTLLSVANLIERKNHVFLLHVFESLRDQIPGIKLVIAGEGPERQRLENMIRDLDLKGVELRGNVHRDKVPALYAEADIFVHPATMDQWPQAINEAMAAGVPVVMSPQSGVTQVFLTNDKEIIIRDLSVNSFVDAITRLLQNSIYRNNIAVAAELKMSALFDTSVKLISDVCKSPGCNKNCMANPN